MTNEPSKLESQAHPERQPRSRYTRERSVGLLGTMRIRKKLVVLHTLFCLVLGIVLLITLRPGATAVVARAEVSQAKAALAVLSASGWDGSGETLPELMAGIEGLEYRVGNSETLGLTPDIVEAAHEVPGQPVAWRSSKAGGYAAMVLADQDGQESVYVVAQAYIPEARRAVLELYAFTIVAILAMYGLIAAFLEMFVLPQNVYSPIARMLDADDAVQEGDGEHEIIDEEFIPADEIGSIMRSRNQTVLSLRQHERDLAEALGRFEIVAADLKRKNHLLENAKRNLADADRLASLGMLSAGIAHELNTPLTVVKGLAEKLDRSGGEGFSAAEARLLVRVVGRLERLGESLLDFARVRPPQTNPVRPAELVDEAVTLVKLDRDAKAVLIENSVDRSLVIACDADRVVQVLVNLIRNAVDAVHDAKECGEVMITGELFVRDGAEWVSLKVTDNGPGIESELIESLFEPFVSSRLDAKGTGLGLAVAEGIVREHGGVILAHNRAQERGAVFEVVLPVVPPGEGLSESGGTLKPPGRDEPEEVESDE
ncbi:MAG: sensor histidine kinase [Phycisphaera sp.]|nr:MAG: sensor histidine kinase [Phycisphaera sp.]